MPRGSKKRKAAKKKQENQPNNHSSASSPSHAGNEEGVNHRDEKQGDVQVEREFKFEGGENSNGINEPKEKSHNGGSSSNGSSGSSSDEEVPKAVKNVRIEELENIPSNGSEKTPLLLEEVRNDSLLEGNEKMVSRAGDEVCKSAEGNKGVIVESDNRAVTEPLLVPEKTSWKSCCGLFEAFSGSG